MAELTGAGIPGDRSSDERAQPTMNQQRITPLDFIDKTSIDPEKSDLKLTELRGQAMVQVFAKKDQINALASSLGIKTEPGVATVTAEFTALPLSRGQWMLSAVAGADGSFCETIRSRIGSSGFVSEQSHGRVIVRVSGAAARKLLQKGCRLDLHASVATAGFCAQTPMAQVGVLMHQIDDTPTYDLYVYSGFAHSFWHWLTEGAAQFGYTAD